MAVDCASSPTHAASPVAFARGPEGLSASARYMGDCFLLGSLSADGEESTDVAILEWTLDSDKRLQKGRCGRYYQIELVDHGATEG